VVELCAFKQHLSILYYLLSAYDNEDKLAIWCRLVDMARRRIDIDATVAFRTLKMMTKPPPPPPPPEPTEDFQDGQSVGQVQGGIEAALLTPAATAPMPRVNATWKSVHACGFEKVVKSQLASNICDDAKVTVSHKMQSALSGPHKCNTTTVQLQYKNFSCITVVLYLCGPLQYNAAIQVFYNLQKACRLLVAVEKQETPAVADKPARRLRKVCTVYVRAVGLL